MCGKPRYFPNNPTILSRVPNSQVELIQSLTTIVNCAPPKKPWSGKFLGLYSGPTSIAYLFLWLSQTHPNLIIEGKKGKEWCEEYLKCGFDEIDTNGVEGRKRMGIKNEYLAWRAVKAALTKDMDVAREMLDGVRNLHESIGEGENELYDGRAGTLALLRVVSFWVSEAKEMVEVAMRMLIRHIISHRPWTWYDGSEFLGAAHGVVGIVLQIVLCDPTFAGVLEGVLEEVLNQQQEDGNWFIKMGKSDKGGYVQWCHGSPGVVIGLVKMRAAFPRLKDKLDSAIEKGRKNV